MQQYKEFKKRAKQAKKSIQQALDEEAGESLQSLVEMLEQFKVTDPTPEEKKKIMRDYKEAYRAMNAAWEKAGKEKKASNKKSYWEE